MPRNVTVTLKNGDRRIYSGVPDNVTSDMISQRAQRETNQSVMQVDGLKPPVPVTTRQQQIQDIARQNIAATDKQRAAAGIVNNPAEAGMSSSVSNFFGLGPRIDAAARYYLGATGGTKIGKTYNDTLDITRAENAQRQASGNQGANFIGSVIGGIGGGGIALKGLGAAAEGLGAIAPKVAPAVNYIQKALSVTRGQPVANAARIVGTGGAFGGAQAVGDGSDVGTGVAEGAAGAGILHAGGAAAGMLGRTLGDVFKINGAAKILQRYTSSTFESLQAAREAWTARTGAEPTLGELLPAGDRQKLKNAIGLMPDNSRQNLTDATRARANNISSEQAAATAKAIEPQQTAQIADTAQRIADSRAPAGSPPVAPTADDTAMATRAVSDPTEMENVRKTISGNIMAPHDNKVVANSIHDLIPKKFIDDGNGGISMGYVDPDQARSILSASGPLRSGENPVTVKDVTSIASALKAGDVRTVEGRNDRASADTLLDATRDAIPEAGPAIDRMNSEHAANSRVIEGMGEGTQTRTRAQAGFDGVSAPDVRTLYDTPEGSAGRAMGQTAQLNNNIVNTPSRAVAETSDIANNPGKQQAVAGNIGPEATAQIADSAAAQTESARNLASFQGEQGGEGGTDLPHLMTTLAGLSPGSMPHTKALSVGRLSRLFQHLPEGASNQIIDGLFSQDPMKIAAGLKFFAGAGDAGQEALRTISHAAMTGAATAANASSEGPKNPTSLDTSIPQPDQQGQPVPDNTQQPAAAAGGPVTSPYAQNLAQMYQEHSPEMNNFTDAIAQQESNHSQFNRDGSTKISPAGAIGLMQIMPGTAPEAARLAGVPYDPDALRNDPSYNKLLGGHLLRNLVDRYGGDSAKAAAAYNTGPTHVDHALANHPNDWLAHLAQETQDYVPNVIGGH